MLGLLRKWAFTTYTGKWALRVAIGSNEEATGGCMTTQIRSSTSQGCINLKKVDSRFPKPMALSATVKVWRLSDITQWIDDHSKYMNDK